MTMAKATRTAKKQVHHASLYITLSSLYNVKLCNFTFYGGHKQKAMILFFFS